MSSMSAIQDFLAQTRIAVIGVSHDPREISRALFKELRTRGYDTVPVNPIARICIRTLRKRGSACLTKNDSWPSGTLPPAMAVTVTLL